MEVIVSQTHAANITPPGKFRAGGFLIIFGKWEFD
jgi:hypothetical protein